MPHLTFIIPIRHPDNAPDWSMTCRLLVATARSIAAQEVSGWRCVVVANEGAELPDLPEGFSVHRVDFPPNPHHDIAAHGKALARDAFRLDKGRRVLSGMLAAPESAYFMIVDDDDFVSSRLSGFVRENSGAPGWHVETGYGWTEGSRYSVRMQGYSGFCGSSLIIRSDLYDLPASLDAADPDFVKDRLGSHVRIKSLLASAGTPLAPLPFAGGVYRVGHANSHSNSGGLWSYFFLRPKYLRHPGRLLANLRGLQRITPGFEREFFGAGDPPTRPRKDDI